MSKIISQENALIWRKEIPQKLELKNSTFKATVFKQLNM